MIPKIIHQTWRDHNLPVDSGLPESWKRHNPAWEYRFWTDEDLAAFIARDYPALLPLFETAPHGVQKADIARYLLLHKFGGLYADIDTQCYRSLDLLTDENRVVLSQEPEEHWAHAKMRGMPMIIFNGTIASPAGHPFWPLVTETLLRCRHGMTKSVLDTTGPLMLTGCVLKYPRQDELAIHSCHLFNPHTKDGRESTGAVFGPLAPARISIHLWGSSWYSEPKDSTSKRLKTWIRKLRYRLTRGPYLNREALEKSLDRDLLARALPDNETPNIAVLIPVRDCAKHAERCIDLLRRLDYPKKNLSVAFCEGDSTDGTYELLEKLARKYADEFREIRLLQHHTGTRFKRKKRWKPEIQKTRRSAIARVRNHLIDRGLPLDADWALWIDADVCDYPPNILKVLLSQEAKIVVPNCVKEPGGATYDQNSFLDIGTAKNASYYKHVHKGLFQPSAGLASRLHFNELRYLDRVPLTCVGGTMLLVHADLHRAGIRFPEIPYDDLLETEGFGKIACDFGLQPVGLPNLEIVHVNE